MAIHKEISFEDEICADLEAAGWWALTRGWNLHDEP